jgi:glycosyltransferase involved in cell wall biosynthesis
MVILLNLLHLTSDRLGGSWTYSYNLLRGLQDLDTTAEFIVLANKNSISRYSGLRMQIVPIEIDAESRVTRVAWEQFSLPRCIKKYAPDVLHGTGNTLPVGISCPSVVTIHDFQYHYYPENFPVFRRNYLRLMVPLALRKAAKVICVSDDTKRDALALGKISEEKISVIHEAGLWKNENNDATDVRLLQQRYAIQKPVILSVGSSLPHKNLTRLLHAYAKICRRIPHDLYLVGDSISLSQHLRDTLTGDTGIDIIQRIHVTGFLGRNDLMGFYRLADMFVFPSVFEGFGIPALEAMACGCPVVAARSRSLPEVIGNAGKLFDPFDIDDMAETILSVASDSYLRSTLRDLGYDRSKIFSWEMMAAKTFEVYKEVTSARHRPSEY